MRREAYRLGAALALVLVTALVACAGGDEVGDPAGETTDPTGDASANAGDAAGGDAAAEDAGDAALAMLCSMHGWCAPEVPDPAPTFVDLWPLATTAFAVSTNGLLQVEGDRWGYVNDRVPFARAVWAATPDDVWVAGQYGRVVHGVRAGGVWTWTEEHLGEDRTLAAIWGSGSNDVYVLDEQRISHRVVQPDGSFSWREELKDELPDDVDPANAWSHQRRLAAIGGTSAGDVWISGWRGASCRYLAHKFQGEYAVVADCAIECTDGAGCSGVSRAPTYFDRIHPNAELYTPSAGRAVSFSGIDLVRFVREAAGTYAVERFELTGWPAYSQSIWGASDTELYVGARAQVVHTGDARPDGGALAVTSIAVNGAPLRADFRVRGTSTANVWAFGGRYAVHKTKP
ncbi:MAG: hypothetical protein KF782_00970 [Labilithrix sp.]|nr:hypothetical protein [Labilithrix sp.]